MERKEIVSMIHDNIGSLVRKLDRTILHNIKGNVGVKISDGTVREIGNILIENTYNNIKNNFGRHERLGK